jgi:PAS domain S-box-containing protein
VRALAELANAIAEKTRLADSARPEARAETGSDSGVQAAQVLREMLGLAEKNPPNVLQKAPARPLPAPRALRPGFDDEAAPMAVIGVDGRFKQLNPSFCRLVGYQEHEFAKAAWPSPHDRQVYVQQQADFADLVSGKLERVAVESTFMHGQGLMIPVVGEISAVKGADGLPSHLLLRAEERERAI